MTKRILWLTVAAVLASVSGWTAPLCEDGTIVDYVALGSTGCQIDDKLFYNFSYIGSGFGGAVAIPADGVAVSVDSTAFMPGLSFFAPWSVGPGQGLDSNIMYSVQVLPGGNPIVAIGASMQGYGQVLDSLVSVAETTVPNIGSLFLYTTSSGTVASATLQVNPPSYGFRVTKDIAVNGNAGVAAVSHVKNSFSEVPEPATYLVLGSALLLLGPLRRWRRVV